MWLVSERGSALTGSVCADGGCSSVQEQKAVTAGWLWLMYLVCLDPHEELAQW
jgi:hypothetical protein